MGSRSLRKGKAWEREVARMLSEASGVECKRELTETREGNVGDIESPLPIAFQCKVGARPNIWTAVKEAEAAAAGTGRFAWAVTKRNGSGSRPPEMIVSMPLADALEILSQLRAGGAW